MIDPTLVNVIYTDANSQKYGVVQSRTAGTCDAGWRLTSATELELCGDTCGYITADPLARISLLSGCPVIAG